MAAACVALTLAAQPLAVLAVGASYVNDTPITLTGPNITLDILAGSTVQSLTVNSTTLVVDVAAGDAATIRYPGPNPGRLPNDGGLSECNNVGGNNDVVVNGPVTVTFTPNTTACNPPSGGGSSMLPATVALTRPNGGEQLSVGTQEWIFWSTDGSEPHSIALELSVDGGLNYASIVADETDDGSYLWTVPGTVTTQARIRIKAVAAGGVIRSQDVSDAVFAIASVASSSGQGSGGGGAATPAKPTATEGGFRPADESASAPSISADKGLVVPATGTPVCPPDTLIKGSARAVYYCGKDGKRYVFPTLGTYRVWFNDFSAVTTISDEALARVPLAGAVTYRPGVRMVKIQTDPKVYAVARGGVLRWVQTEEIAAALYGSDWNEKIDDLSDALFAAYRFGDPITAAQ